jgi:hypothetical protein
MHVLTLLLSQGDPGSKKLGRLEDFADLGAGYDETDPFIDNTDAVRTEPFVWKPTALHTAI